jgi:hypothetical protein
MRKRAVGDGNMGITHTAELHSHFIRDQILGEGFEHSIWLLKMCKNVSSHTCGQTTYMRTDHVWLQQPVTVCACHTEHVDTTLYMFYVLF